VARSRRVLSAEPERSHAPAKRRHSVVSGMARWQRVVSVAQRAGVDFLGLTYGTHDDLQAMRFGKGSFMLDWNGKGGAFKVEVQTGVWQRRYERGLVVVNTTRRP
jgi:hypothetical protein